MLSRLLLALLFLPLSVSAIDAETVANEVTDNVSSEYAACAAYFAIVSEAISRSGDTKTSTQYSKMQNIAMDYSLVAAKSSRSDEMAVKVTLARFESFLKGMGEDIGKDISNISILSNEYAFTCKQAMEKPEKFMEQIQNKVILKHAKQNR